MPTDNEAPNAVSDRLISRRGLLAGAGAAGLALAAGAGASPLEAAGGIIGQGRWRYELVPGWGIPPDGIRYGFGCAVVVDARDRVYVHTQAQQMVLVFDREGTLLGDFSTDFAGTRTASGHASGHGLYLAREGRHEFLYFTVLAPFHQVIKTDLQGRVLLRIGQVREESSTSARFPLNQPTDCAVAPSGDIYVCEGYGGNVVHRFNAQGKYLQTIGKPGKGAGEFSTCHGIWVDTRRGEPELYVADRNNSRLQVFSLGGELRREIREGIRQPCCFYQHKDLLFIPDLDKVVTLLDRQDRVVAQLGDGRTDPGDLAFQMPHAVAVDSRGDLYCVEWVPDARLRKFRHAPRKG
jgi:peptidylamidoglycolate lyase